MRFSINFPPPAPYTSYSHSISRHKVNTKIDWHLWRLCHWASRAGHPGSVALQLSAVSFPPPPSVPLYPYFLASANFLHSFQFSSRKRWRILVSLGSSEAMHLCCERMPLRVPLEIARDIELHTKGKRQMPAWQLLKNIPSDDGADGL